MRILIYGINFSPELTGIGRYTGEMANWLSARGHGVRVVTAPPYYPDWHIGPGYSTWRYRRERWPFQDGAVTVWRCPLWVPRIPSGTKRLAHLMSFSLSSAPLALAHTIWMPDIVVSVAPALFSAPAAWLAARLGRSKAWLHIQDFEVDAAFDMGMLRSARARRACLAIERTLLKRFDKVSTISERMQDRLIQKGVDEHQSTLFPNWADIGSIHPLARPSEFRRELGIADNTVVVLYAGNLGEKQGLDILVTAAEQTQDRSDILWVIAGAGSARARLEALSAGFANLKWLPLQPARRLNELLNLADIHVLPQRAEAADLVMPSKLTGMLASGRAVVATATAGTQVAAVATRCGIVSPPGDGGALASAVQQLADDPARRERLGQQARRYAEEFFDRDKIMSRFEESITTLVNESKNSLRNP